MGRISASGHSRVLVLGMWAMWASCVGSVGAASERDRFRATGDEGGVGEGDVALAPVGDAGSADASACLNADGASTDCACAVDSDRDGTFDCEDGCPVDPAVTTPGRWYADCDGDGEPSSTATLTCDTSETGRPASPCQDGKDPLGPWSDAAGTDCNDEDGSAVAPGDWYPDCDGDGTPSAQPVRACGILAALLAYDCSDGVDPEGGFWSIRGSDCNDEDRGAAQILAWYADCDGDGVATSKATHACGVRGARAILSCIDGEEPDGGFWGVVGSDCDDELASDRCPCGEVDPDHDGVCTAD